MEAYKVYLIGADNLSGPGVQARCVGDREACALAQRMLTKDKASAEVWADNRLVAIVAPPKASEMSELTTLWR